MAESLAPGATLADVARRQGTRSWQAHDWRKKLRSEQLTVPESMAGLPVFAELMVEDPVEEVPASQTVPTMEIVVGRVIIRAKTYTGDGVLTRAEQATTS